MSLLQQIQDAAGEMELDAAIPPVEDKEELICIIAESVTAKDSRTLQAYILEQRLPSPEQFWELTTLLAPCLTTENLEEVPQFFTTVRRCLTYFSRHGKPKEMVLAFLEQIEGFRDDALFVTLLPCLQNALLQLPVKRGRSLELALDTLGCHIRGIPAPKNWNLEGEETKLFENDETVRRFLSVVPAFLDFMQPFLQGAGAEGDGKGWQWERRVLRKHLLQLLEHPLVFLDLRHNSKENSSKTYSREMAETLVQCLTKVESNFYRLLMQDPAEGKITFAERKEKHKKSSGEVEVEDTDMEAENAENELRASGAAQSEDSEGVEEELSQLSGACLAYLVQVEWLGQERWPKIHSIPHLFHANLPYVRALLTNAAHTAVYKGVTLLSFYLDLMDDLTLDGDTLDDDNVMPVVNAVITVMRFCPIRQLRFFALELFKTFFAKLDCRGCHQLMKSVMASCEHAGVKAVVVSLIKDNIDAALKTLDTGKAESGKKAASESPAREKPVEDGNSRPFYFFKDRLKQLLQLATKLAEGAATDLLEQSDLIMATLNLLRYLVLRDSDNRTGVWDMLPWLEKEYFSALRTGLDMSVGHYKLELDNLNKQAASQPKKREEIAATVSVAGTQLPPMTQDQRLNVMHSALTTFDMMKWMQQLLRGQKRTFSRSCFCLAGTDAGDTTTHSNEQHQDQEHTGEQHDPDYTAQEEYDTRQQILRASLPFVHQYGWTSKAIAAGAEKEGFPSVSHGMFPRGGAELVHFFYTTSNQELAQQLAEKVKEQGDEKPKTREFIRDAVETRLRMILPYIDTWAQAMAIQTLPQNAVESWTNLANLVDEIWYYAGDRSVDFSWYTKRTSLAGVYKATEIYMLQDESEDKSDTWEFLDRRLDNLQTFGKAVRNSSQMGTVMKEGLWGMCIMGRNILGMNPRHR